ncbi:hypothetical protein [Chromobacterium rhizoryzae]|uniref:hypothetical protein n=1 Tax=Chromobacterium rhizoryzae TaxID=1778675 RepID=UPI001D060B39|nr:hypothetical protein [Chromobacterium rhizoryzae]
MKTFKDYVEEIKEKQGLTSNHQVAKLLLIDTHKMGDIMKGIRQPPPVAGYVIADVLGLDAREVKACLDYENTKDPVAKEYIKSIFLRHSRNVAALFLAITMLAGAHDSRASTTAKTSMHNGHNVPLCEYQDKPR